MTENDAVKIFQQTGAWITNGHYAYASGRHGADYLNKYAVYPHIQLVSKLCQSVASRFIHDNVQIVVAPAMGGIVLSHRVASHLSDLTGKKVLSIYAEKSDRADFFELNHNYGDLVNKKKVLVVEDILNSGGSVLKVVKLIRLCGGQVVGVGALWNRDKVTEEDLGNAPKLYSLIDIKIDSWSKSECLLCKRGIPISKKP